MVCNTDSIGADRLDDVVEVHSARPGREGAEYHDGWQERGDTACARRPMSYTAGQTQVPCLREIEIFGGFEVA